MFLRAKLRDLVSGQFSRRHITARIDYSFAVHIIGIVIMPHATYRGCTRGGMQRVCTHLSFLIFFRVYMRVHRKRFEKTIWRFFISAFYPFCPLDVSAQLPHNIIARINQFLVSAI